MTAYPVVIRPVCADDAPALVQLAALLDTMNLPRDPEVVEMLKKFSGVDPLPSR